MAENTIDEKVELIPRNYQAELVRICVEKNTIIYLPTGSGKTFIALCALKELSRDCFEKSYIDGGKLSVVIVNTVTLVHQHVKTFQQSTTYKVRGYTGDMNLDYWSQEQWLLEYNQSNVIVLTAQIFKNSLQSNFIDLNQVNLIIFDECHHGVENHPMREIMKSFQEVAHPPRVIGLTATLLNGNVKPNKVVEEVNKLETTFNAKVATVESLASVIGFATKPQEIVMYYRSPATCHIIEEACMEMNNLEATLRSFKLKPKVTRKNSGELPLLKHDKPFEKFYKLLMDAQIHFKMLGIAGARIACTIYSIHLELEKRHVADSKSPIIINAIISAFASVRCRLDDVYFNTPSDRRLLMHSSNKFQKLIHILQSYGRNSNEDLCGIIFVQRKNTALFLYHLLREMKTQYEDFDFLRPDFIIGTNSNPLSMSTESLYHTKVNKKIINKFNTKEVNLLIASNVIEEGIDVQICTLVVKFDAILDYRAYVQSKGRARHSTSLFYIMVEKSTDHKFESNYQQFQAIEKNLNEYLLGTYNERPNPNKGSIANMYDESVPFYVKGFGSANFNEVAATQLLMMYCSSVKADAYTIYEPIMYLDRHRANGKCRVEIELPIFCPIQNRIVGEWKNTKKDAKRSACYNACVALYKIGELTENLVPKPQQLQPSSIEHLFRHWPESSDKTDGGSKIKKPYAKVIPDCLTSPISSGSRLHLHVIHFDPLFDSKDTELLNCYTDDLCYGFITAHPLPIICDFPTFTKFGTLHVRLQVNHSTVVLSEEQLRDVKNFHRLLFNDILGITPFYLVMGNNNTQYAYLVPFRKIANSIDFLTISTHREIVDTSKEPTTEERLNMIVNNDTHLLKIVTPYYRTERWHHLVLEVCDDLTSLSNFPNAEHTSYREYFHSKYDRSIVNVNAPLLVVKPLPRALNCLRPRGAATKRRREEDYEFAVQHFVPELCIKQEFPHILWVISSLLPSIFHRIDQFLKADQLRRIIARKVFPATLLRRNWDALKVDKRLIKYKTTEATNITMEAKNDEISVDLDLTPKQITDMINSNTFNREYFESMNDMKYPWDSEMEPQVDCYRNIAATQLDIELYSKFLSMHFHKVEEKASAVPPMRCHGMLAINYEQKYAHKAIKLLTPGTLLEGPELTLICEALTSAKAHDIVNLERLETLGDSCLKFIASYYIFVQFPHYNEGQATQLKSRIISNRNLFYAANAKEIGGYIKESDLNARDEWLPPGYCTPIEAQRMIETNRMHIGKLFDITTSKEEQLSGVLSAENVANLNDFAHNCDEDVELDSSMCHYINIHKIADKTIADAVEALIGTYVESMGLQGALAIINWFGILPDDCKTMFSMPIKDPIINERSSTTFSGILPSHEIAEVETILDYKFANPAFLLQALTHTSFSSNRLTESYQRLEFIGDAVLDMLITMHIYEHNQTLNPGELTDLRSALVNNETFAAYVVKLRLHKYLKHYNNKLTNAIIKFDNYQAARNHEITSDVLVLLNEEHLRIAENVDVPKILGDLFESLIGAIFLDSGLNFAEVWRVIYKIMWMEMDSFARDVPKNPTRMLYESLAPLKPTFSESYEVDSVTFMMKVDFILNGSLTRVHGFGTSASNAKKAAAKIALRLLSMKQK